MLSAQLYDCAFSRLGSYGIWEDSSLADLSHELAVDGGKGLGLFNFTEGDDLVREEEQKANYGAQFHRYADFKHPLETRYSIPTAHGTSSILNNGAAVFPDLLLAALDRLLAESTPPLARMTRLSSRYSPRLQLSHTQALLSSGQSPLLDNIVVQGSAMHWQLAVLSDMPVLDLGSTVTSRTLSLETPHSVSTQL
jgi:hypothetical protein